MHHDALDKEQNHLARLNAILERRDSLGITSTETYAPVLRPRELPLFNSPDEITSILHELGARSSSQLHCSYFGNPTALFQGPSSSAYQALLKNMGGPDEFRKYYGDLTGEHVIARACQEYELAVRAGLDHYTVHFGIDYSFSDGMFSYPTSYGLDREAVLESSLRQTAVYLRRFESHLARVGLLTSGQKLPTIGIENAGWGLEYGIQTAGDFKRLFAYLDDVKSPLRDLVTIDWDFNHLLHALGRNAAGVASFMLPEEERTPEMRALERELACNPAALAAEWIRLNVRTEELRGRVRCIHLSDCAWKTAPIFARCQAIGEYLKRLTQEANPEARAALGEELVVTHYDNHLFLGHERGMLEQAYIAPIFEALRNEQGARASTGTPLIILHELKGYPFMPTPGEVSQEMAAQAQVNFLKECGVFFSEARMEVRI